MDWLLLLVIPLIIAGFVIRINPFFLTTFAALYTGIIANGNIYTTIDSIGKAFVENRYVGIVWLILPLLGILERHGLKKQAEQIVSQFKKATAAKILIAYFTFRQITAALGLLSLGGHARTIRPLVAPMAEAAAKIKYQNLKNHDIQKIKAHCAASDNVAAFFGEDIFIAVHSILLIVAFYEGYGIELKPIELSVWAIPTAIIAYIVHCSRIYLLDRTLHKNSSRYGDD